MQIAARTSVLIGVLSGSLTAAHHTRSTANAAAPDEFAAEAKAVAQDLVKRDYAAIVSRFGEQMKAALPGAQLRATWEHLEASSGTFQGLSASPVPASPSRDVHQVLVRLNYEKATWSLRVALDPQLRIVGLFIAPAVRPGEAAVTWTPPPYGRAKVIERPVKVGPRGLAGTLVLPVGNGPFPAVVLVHGSGPHDADETIGPNKPFRDIALGLAARGIASLRYEKRTHADPGSFVGNNKITVNEETIDDAIAGVRLTARAAGVDAGRTWVLGHSLGGFLAPRLATRVPEIAGLVILAGPTRPLEELILEQTRYLTGAASKATADARAFVKAVRDPNLTDTQSVDMLGAHLPASYFLDLRRYDPVTTAQDLRLPILVLQGERDYQVGRADYDGWTRALSGHQNATLKLYPALNHLFEPGQGQSRPEEYRRPGLHVDAAVIADIAHFILNDPPAPSAPLRGIEVKR